MSELPTAQRPLNQRLKEDNWDLHQIAENGDGPAALMRGEGGMDDYVRMLEQEYLWHKRLDEVVVDARKADPRMSDLVPDHHLRAGYLEKDLDHLGSDRAALEPAPGTARFIAYIDEHAKDPMRALGLHYVRTGATNGNHFVAKKLRPMLGLADDGSGTRHLDPWGKAQRSEWMTFKGKLGETDLTADEQDRVFRAVRDSYLYHISMNDPDRFIPEAEVLERFSEKLDKSAFDLNHAIKRA